MAKVRKAIIPVAGYGTSFLPATKAQPKELLPIVDKPIIQFTVEEALAAGIEEIVIITGRHKRPVEDHFDSNPELEDNLLKKHKDDLLEIVRSTTQTNLYFARQPYPLGLGEALLHARAFIDNEPFAVLLADNIFQTEVPAIRQLMDVYEQFDVPTVAAMPVPENRVSEYGIIAPSSTLESNAGTLYQIESLIEKPKQAEAPSNLAVAGRYVLRPDIFDILEKLKPDASSGEIELTEGLNLLNQTQRVFAKEIEGTRFDVGNKLGYMEMSLYYGLQHPETSEELAEYLIQLADQWS